MKQFDLNRFGQALKCHFMVSRKTWIRVFGIYTFVLFMANLFFTRLSFRGYEQMAKEYPNMVEGTYFHIVDQTTVFAFIFFCFAMTIGASLLFNHMKTTPQRSAYLTWPVSNLEKYIVAILHHVVLMFVVTIVAIILADAMRVLVDWMTGRVIIWGFPIPFEAASDSSKPDIFVAWVFGWLFYFHSVYILGGSLFRRQQFLLTSLLVVIGFFLVMWGVSATDEMIDWHGFPSYYQWDGNGHSHLVFHPLFYVSLTLLYLLTVFHYWASYKIFCRMQVINNKWLNI